MSKQKNLTDADHKIIVEAYNRLSDKDSLSKNKIKKILNEQLGYSESSIYRVITVEQKKSTDSEDSITQLLQQINKYTNSNIAEQLKKMNLEQLLNKYEQINPADVAYRTLIEKLMIECQAFETKMSLLEKQHQIDKDKYTDNQARREHELAQLKTQKQNKQIARQNAETRLKATETVKSKKELEADTELKLAEGKNIKELLKDISKQVETIPSACTLKQVLEAADFVRLVNQSGVDELKSETRYIGALEIIDTFTDNSDRNILNRIKNNHKHRIASKLSTEYLIKEFVLPKSETWTALSEPQQAELIKDKGSPLNLLGTMSRL